MPAPRFVVDGDACAICSTRIKPGDFLIRIQTMSYTGYLHTEICVPCLFKHKREEINAALAKDQ